MSNVLIDRQKIDILANAISDKSGVPVTMTLDEMVDAVDSIEAGSAEPVLQAKTYTVDSAGTATVTADSGYDGLSEVEVNVPSASVVDDDHSSEFYNVGNARKWRTQYWADYAGGGFLDGVQYGSYMTRDAVSANTTITPTESSQTIGGYNYMMEGAVTVNAIPSNYVGSGIDARDMSDVTISGKNVAIPWGYYEDGGSVNVASGTAGTPTATKGSVSNHSISVTPSVTNTTGYITGSTINGTAVTVSASELVSGSQTITDNGTVDVTNLAEIVVDVAGGGGGGINVGTATKTLSATASSIQFTGLSGNPTSFVVTSSADQTTGGTKVVSVAYDGTNLFGMDITTQAEADTGFTKSYSSGTLTITATTAQFQANEYKLVYTYGGSSSDIHTADVQVGSGATSITFSSLSGKPAYFSCVFKSSFGTSSGYQRVIDVVNDGTNTYGHAFDSSGKAQTSWSYSYSGGSLTISSTGTNNGGYFHQPGYYQLTYTVDDSAPNYQTKTVTPTSSQQIVTADSGYDALEQVTVSAIPNTYVQPTSTIGATTYRASTSNQTIASGTYHSAAATIAAVSQTNLSAENIKSGTTISISNGQSNLWSVTGTYTGGGGSSDVATGTLTVASNVNTSTNTQITTTTAIGFTPTKFFFWKDERAATSNHVNQATFTTIGSYYIRTMTRYSSNALSTSGNANNWTTQTAGYLYFNNNTIYFRSSSSYILSSGTWSWVAVK